MRRSCLLVHNSINRPHLYPSYSSLPRVNHTHALQLFADVRHYTLKGSRDLNAVKIHEPFMYFYRLLLPESRVIDFDDWSVSVGFFKYILSLFGLFSVDRLASPDSAKCAMSR